MTSMRGRLTKRLYGMFSLLVGIPALAGAETDQQRFGAHGLALPATFSGTLPCADCPGIEYHLDIWNEDQGYALRRTYLERDHVEDELGRWYVDPVRNALILEGTGNARSEWQITPDQDIRLLDQEGEPIVSDLPYTLVAGPLVPTELRLPVTGLMTYFADAALFTECLSGQRFPIAMEADYLALERAYLDADIEPGAPLIARIDAEISMRAQTEGSDRMTVTVERFHHVTPDAACPDTRSAAGLLNTFWGLTHLDGVEQDQTDGRQEPYVLISEDGTRFSGTMGCNRFMGPLSIAGDSVEFGPVASTMMACPPELAAREAAFAEMLEAAQRVDLMDHSLRLLGETGAEPARFRAVYTRY
ncbi:MAG: META domain-containing protein [Rhodobacteraceae bacterium]|nr:MAG: META domain-containing protein [Paracoccaceae bacterium]